MVKPHREQDDIKDTWRNSPRVASHWRRLDDSDRVECSLSPRHCNIANGKSGFCGVRRNVDGVLVTDNFGKAVAAAEEVIETEAIFHYRPGARILSMGNIGCMMSCRFCQNWTTSQVRHLDTSVIQFLSPTDVVKIAKSHEIDVISWTYNDPVVWHEFVLETSRLARDAGIKTLFKSALYIESKPLAELLDVIDIWSISLKSLDAKFYKKITAATLEPVLERIQQVRASSRHLEISQLIITALNDTEDAIRQTIDWHLKNLGEDIPLHFVRFHPAFRYMDVERTPKNILHRAAEMGRESGIHHVYLGNLTDAGVSDTRCAACDTTLVARYGLSTEVVGIDSGGRCKSCQTPSPIVEPFAARSRAALNYGQDDNRPQVEHVHAWTEEINSIHLEVPNPDMDPVGVFIDRGDPEQYEYVQLGGQLSRVLVSRRSDAEHQIKLHWQASSGVRVMPVLDRAHLYTGEN